MVHRIDLFLGFAAIRNASTLLLTPGTPGIVRVRGDLSPLPTPRLEAGDVREICLSRLTEEERAAFERDREWEADWQLPGLGKFHVSLYFSRGDVCGVFTRDAPGRDAGPPPGDLPQGPIGPGDWGPGPGGGGLPRSGWDLPGPGGSGSGVPSPVLAGPPARSAGYEEPIPWEDEPCG